MARKVIATPPLPVGNCEGNNPCPSQCANVFDRVHVSHIIRGGTRVMWDLLPEFDDPFPYTFQLEVGRTSNPDANDWENVGLPQENTFFAVDGDQRVWGKTQYTHYRVKLTTSKGVYYSEPTGGLGVLGRRDWRIAREILRQEKLRHRYASQEGYLLKRITTGLKCHVCLDRQTDEVKDPDCPVCYGTGYQCGYFYPMACVWADLSPKTRRKELDAGQGRGVISDITVPARMLMVPLMEEYDVWVARKTDDRYYIHRIQNVAEIRGVPIAANVELRPAPFTDIIYDVPIPNQIED